MGLHHPVHSLNRTYYIHSVEYIIRAQQHMINTTTHCSKDLARKDTADPYTHSIEHTIYISIEHTICTGHFPQKSPIIRGSFAKYDL